MCVCVCVCVGGGGGGGGGCRCAGRDQCESTESLISAVSVLKCLLVAL